MTMNILQQNALAYKKLMNYEYYFCIAHKGVGKEVRVCFDAEQFKHLQGFSQIIDLDIHTLNAEKLLQLCIDGGVNIADIQKSNFYFKHSINKKVAYLALLERSFDLDNIIFNLSKDSSGNEKIRGELMLNSCPDDQNICVYLERRDKRLSDYFCKSFVANSERDRTRNATKMNILWKEKIYLPDHSSEVLYQYKNFTPDQLYIPDHAKQNRPILGKSFQANIEDKGSDHPIDDISFC